MPQHLSGFDFKKVCRVMHSTGVGDAAEPGPILAEYRLATAPEALNLDPTGKVPDSEPILGYGRQASGIGAELDSLNINAMPWPSQSFAALEGCSAQSIFGVREDGPVHGARCVNRLKCRSHGRGRIVVVQMRQRLGRELMAPRGALMG